MALQSLAEGDHDGINAALAALLTPGGLAVLRRSPEEFVRVVRSPILLETPKLVWGPKCREELEELLKQVRESGAVSACSMGVGEGVVEATAVLCSAEVVPSH